MPFSSVDIAVLHPSRRTDAARLQGAIGPAMGALALVALPNADCCWMLGVVRRSRWWRAIALARDDEPGSIEPIVIIHV